MKLLKDSIRTLRILYLITVDVMIVNASVFASLLLRYELSLENLTESGYINNYLAIAPMFTAACIAIFALFGLYRSLWKYAGVEELEKIGLSVFFANSTLPFFWLILEQPLPRSLPFINFLMLFFLLFAFRFAYRSLRYLRNRFTAKSKKRTMLIGGGAAGSLVLSDLNQGNHSKNKVVCIIDDNPVKHDIYIHGVRCVGGRESIVKMAKQYQVTDIIFAIPTAPAADRREIIQLCQQTGCKLQILPGIYQLASGEINVQPLRDVQVEDLLGREKVVVDSSGIGEALAGKTILVTGGGGSIGSELCRQVAQYAIKRLIIFDIYENNAYDLQQELRRKHPELDLVVLIGSVRDEARVDAVFEKYHPEVVCHAAAHKHVPLMEDSPAESIKNNVFGTFHVAKAADKYHAESFVLISTDKAVNPTNIMGASKRICEMIVQTMGKISKTKFAAVRFGNVLGSNGSVIPLFKKQIAAGGPVTVTHKDIIRYFMTIPEAVSLVLQACLYAKDGEVFVLDMGDPVKIDDLARNMIRLSGLEPDVDIPIVYTGLRPGEKLYEELLMQEEGLDKTPNDLIFIGHFNDFDRESLIEALDELEDACVNNPEGIRDVVRKLVKTYHPAD